MSYIEKCVVLTGGLEVSFSIFQYICSAQSENLDNSGIALCKVRIPKGGQSENSYLVRYNSGIVCAQSENRDKMRIVYSQHVLRVKLIWNRGFQTFTQ